MEPTKIDIYNHVMPPAYLELVKQHGKEPGMVRRVSNLRLLWDIEARVAMLDQWPEVQQVLTLSVPAPEMLGGPEASPAFARVANDGMAEMCRQWPHKFPAFVASLPMNNPAAALEEMDRAVETLGARGIQVLTNVNSRPLDDADFFAVFERITRKHKLPVWMHPARPASRADYAGEDKSKYEIWQVLGWPFESSVAMSRIVFSGLFDRLPDLRMMTLWAQLGSRSVDPAESQVLQNLQKAPIEYFRMFYGDTVLGGSASALRCGLDFFGADKVVFASDCPFDPEEGPMFIREGIRSIESLHLPEGDKRKIYFGNAIGLLGFPPPAADK